MFVRNRRTLAINSLHILLIFLLMLLLNADFFINPLQAQEETGSAKDKGHSSVSGSDSESYDSDDADDASDSGDSDESDGAASLDKKGGKTVSPKTKKRDREDTKKTKKDKKHKKEKTTTATTTAEKKSATKLQKTTQTQSADEEIKSTKKAKSVLEDLQRFKGLNPFNLKKDFLTDQYHFPKIKRFIEAHYIKKNLIRSLKKYPRGSVEWNAWRDFNRQADFHVSQWLLKIRNNLKEQFVSLEPIVDQIFNHIEAQFFGASSTADRPLVLVILATPGQGKTALVRKLVDDLGIADSYYSKLKADTPFLDLEQLIKYSYVKNSIKKPQGPALIVFDEYKEIRHHRDLMEKKDKVLEELKEVEAQIEENSARKEMAAREAALALANASAAAAAAIASNTATTTTTTTLPTAPTGLRGGSAGLPVQQTNSQNTYDTRAGLLEEKKRLLKFQLDVANTDLEQRKKDLDKLFEILGNGTLTVHRTGDPRDTIKNLNNDFYGRYNSPSDHLNKLRVEISTLVAWEAVLKKKENDPAALLKMQGTADDMETKKAQWDKELPALSLQLKTAEEDLGQILAENAAIEAAEAAAAATAEAAAAASAVAAKSAVDDIAEKSDAEVAAVAEVSGVAGVVRVTEIADTVTDVTDVAKAAETTKVTIPSTTAKNKVAQIKKAIEELTKKISTSKSAIEILDVKIEKISKEINTAKTNIASLKKDVLPNLEHQFAKTFKEAYRARIKNLLEATNEHGYPQLFADFFDIAHVENYLGQDDQLEEVQDTMVKIMLEKTKTWHALPVDEIKSIDLTDFFRTEILDKMYKRVADVPTSIEWYFGHEIIVLFGNDAELEKKAMTATVEHGLQLQSTGKGDDSTAPSTGSTGPGSSETAGAGVGGGSASGGASGADAGIVSSASQTGAVVITEKNIDPAIYHIKYKQLKTNEQATTDLQDQLALFHPNRGAFQSRLATQVLPPPSPIQWKMVAENFFKDQLSNIIDKIEKFYGVKMHVSLDPTIGNYYYENGRTPIKGFRRYKDLYEKYFNVAMKQIGEQILFFASRGDIDLDQEHFFHIDLSFPEKPGEVNSKLVLSYLKSTSASAVAPTLATAPLFTATATPAVTTAGTTPFAGMFPQPLLPPKAISVSTQDGPKFKIMEYELDDRSIRGHLTTLSSEMKESSKLPSDYITTLRLSSQLILGTFLNGKLPNRVVKSADFYAEKQWGTIHSIDQERDIYFLLNSLQVYFIGNYVEKSHPELVSMDGTSKEFFANEQHIIEILKKIKILREHDKSLAFTRALATTSFSRENSEPLLYLLDKIPFDQLDKQQGEAYDLLMKAFSKYITFWQSSFPEVFSTFEKVFLGKNSFEPAQFHDFFQEYLDHLNSQIPTTSAAGMPQLTSKINLVRKILNIPLLPAATATATTGDHCTESAPSSAWNSHQFPFKNYIDQFIQQCIFFHEQQKQLKEQEKEHHASVAPCDPESDLSMDDE